MKVSWTAGGIALGGIILMVALIGFMISDFTDPDSTLLETKPWRPIARLGFGAILFPITTFFLQWSAACFSRLIRSGWIGD